MVVPVFLGWAAIMPLLVGRFFLLFSVFGLVLFIVARFEDVRAVVEAHLQTDGFDLHCSGRALDIIPHGVSKWTGAQFFLEHYGKQATRLAAIGDSPGDLPILTQVDFAACPANAADSVKAVCDFVSDADEVYGVTDIFQRFFA